MFSGSPPITISFFSETIDNVTNNVIVNKVRQENNTVRYLLKGQQHLNKTTKHINEIINIPIV